jgi:hypothetical protein
LFFGLFLAFGWLEKSFMSRAVIGLISWNLWSQKATRSPWLTSFMAKREHFRFHSFSLSILYIHVDPIDLFFFHMSRAIHGIHKRSSDDTLFGSSDSRKHGVPDAYWVPDRTITDSLFLRILIFPHFIFVIMVSLYSLG